MTGEHVRRRHRDRLLAGHIGPRCRRGRRRRTAQHGAPRRTAGPWGGCRHDRSGRRPARRHRDRHHPARGDRSLARIIVARPGAVTRRAISLLGEDVDALEEAWEIAGPGADGRVVKVQAPGPITLAAQLELGNGHRAITDAGALRELTASLAEGVAEGVAG